MLFNLTDYYIQIGFHCFWIEKQFRAFFYCNILGCQTNPCLNGGACVENVSGVTCQCASGYGGTFCDVIGMKPLEFLISFYRTDSVTNFLIRLNIYMYLLFPLLLSKQLFSVNLIMSFCFQLGHSSVALTPERSVASCPRRWMTGMTGYLGRWVPSVIFYVHFSFWLTAFIQNVISHHLYEIKICCLNNISFQNLL